MKNMKSPTILLVCSLLLGIVITTGGCSMGSSGQSTEKTQETTGIEILHEDAQAEYEINESREELQEKALLAYQEILKAAPAIEGEHEELVDAAFDYDENLRLFGNHYELFALYDINQDEIPELIALSTVNFRWTPIFVYTYANGEAILIRNQFDAQTCGTFEQRSTANGAYITYICEVNHIHSVWRGTNPMGEDEEENHAYVLNGATLTEIDCSIGETENTIYFDDIAKANTAENVDAMTLKETRQSVRN